MSEKNDSSHHLGPDKENFLEHKMVNIFLPINLNMCFGCSKEPSHGDGSFEYPQHMFCLKIEKNNFQLHTFILNKGEVGTIFKK